MRTVRDDTGQHYLLVKQSGESSKVRDPETGEETYIQNDDLEAVMGESPLQTAANAIPTPIRRILTGTPDERALGLLVELHARGPLAVRQLMSAYDLCESDLHGRLAELQAAELITETTVAGERGYDLTADAETAIDVLTEN